MFAITSTRIVGLIAVVCAVVVAPQALAMQITESNTAAPTVAPPDAAMGYDLSPFDIGGLNDILGYQQQEESLKFLARASADTHKSVDAAKKAAAIKAAKKAAAIKALRRRSVDLEAAYRKLHPDAYRPAVQPAARKSGTAAVWNFPSCIPRTAAEYDSYKYSCGLSAPAPTVGTIGLAPATESDKAAVWSFPVFCNGQAQAQYDSGC